MSNSKAWKRQLKSAAKREASRAFNQNTNSPIWDNDSLRFDCKRVDKLKIPQGEKQAPDITRDCFVRNEFLSGYLTFTRSGGFWICSGAPDNLKFMRGLDGRKAKFELLRRGFDWDWLPF